MFERISDVPLHVAIQDAVVETIGAETAILWIVNDETKTTHAPSLAKAAPCAVSIVAKCKEDNEVIYVERPAMHDEFDQNVDSPNTATIYLPIAYRNGIVRAIVQCFASEENRMFTNEQVDCAKKMARKFVSYVQVLFPDVGLDLTTSLLSRNELNVLDSLAAGLQKFFKCRAVEYVSATKLGGGFYSYSTETADFQEIENPGFATFTVTNQAPLIAKNVLETPGYCAAIDGEGEESVMALPVMATDEAKYAIVLRGKEKGEFNGADLTYFRAVIPFVAHAITIAGSKSDAPSAKGTSARNADGHAEGRIANAVGDGNDAMLSEKLKALLEVAEALSGVLDIDLLIVTIMEKACALLNTERCSLFLVDAEKQELVSCFHGGLDTRLRVPLNRGIVGHTATTGAVVNIPDAYKDPRFDQSVDLKTGFVTRNLLTVPIHNDRGEIAGVTEMINKIDGGEFDEEDIKMLMAFNVFCGISLDNSRLYKMSLDLTRQLRSFVGMSTSLNTTSTVKDVLQGVLSNAASVVHAARATVYTYEVEGQVLTELVSIGDRSIASDMFARDAIQERKLMLFKKEDVAMRMQIAAINNGVELPAMCVSMSLSRVNSALSSALQSDVETSRSNGQPTGSSRNVVAIPLMTSDGKIIGVMEMTCPWRVTTDDVKLLDCFAVFAAVSLERSELKAIAAHGHVESAIKQWLLPDERSNFAIPEKLQLTDEQRDMVFTINFDAPLFDGYGHFKVLWAIFDSFGFLERFKITNERLFRFLTAISDTYKKVPYHNWRHAVDVTQFVQYEIKLTKLNDKLTALELFGLVVAAICHDANHDGFTNVFNEKAETPLGILFKNQSVMETHHCSIAIGIISKEETNLFHGVDSDEYRQLWTFIIGLILSTDMAKHFNFLKQVNGVLDEGPADMENPKHRAMISDLVLKCADISNVSRPFEMANKWCDVLCEEFFRQGDLETTHGMEYTSPLNDRAHLDKPKSQIGFYTFVCLPLYETAARALPELQVNVDQVKSNLGVWKGEAEGKGKQPNT